MLIYVIKSEGNLFDYILENLNVNVWNEWDVFVKILNVGVEKVVVLKKSIG